MIAWRPKQSLTCFARRRFSGGLPSAGLTYHPANTSTSADCSTKYRHAGWAARDSPTANFPTVGYLSEAGVPVNYLRSKIRIRQAPFDSWEHDTPVAADIPRLPKDGPKAKVHRFGADCHSG